MKYCTVDDIYKNQKDLTFEGGSKCRVLVDGAEIDICKVMPDNLILLFERFCDGCYKFSCDTSWSIGNDNVYITCKHMDACKDLIWRLSNGDDEM